MKLSIKFHKLLALIFLVILSLVPLIWFWKKGSALINGVDTNFPLNPLIWLGRRFYTWSSVNNAGSDFSSSTAGIFFHSIQTIPYILGLNLQTIEIISLIFWFATIVISAFLLARLFFPKKVIIQLVFVVLYSFNPYLFNTWENVKVANLSLVASIPLALTILIYFWNGKINYLNAMLYSVIPAIILSGAGINPAYFSTFFLILLTFFIPSILLCRDKKIILGRLGKIILMSLVIILVNFFWLFPTTNFIINTIPSGNSINEIGFSNWLNSLSENTNIVNVMRLQGAWDWYAFDSESGLPLYIPYALNYFYTLPFLVFSFLVPLIAILALFLCEKNKRYLCVVFGLMLIIGVFMGSGSHQPTGEIFNFMINHIPFFSLFRSPWYIFTPFLLISLAGLIGLFLDSLANKLVNLRFNKQIVFLISVLLIIANLLYTYPLSSGKIFRPDRKDGFYIMFPEYIFQAADWLNNNIEGRVVGYPSDEIENFEWGYRGIDSILNLFSDTEMINQSLNAADIKAGLLIKELYRALEKGQMESVYKIAAKLNITMILDKQDQKSLALPLSQSIKNLEHRNFGPWFFYKIPIQQFLPKIFAAKDIFVTSSFSAVQTSAGIIDANSIIVDSSDTIVNEIPDFSEINKISILSENSQNNDFYSFTSSPSILFKRLQSRDLSQVEYRFNIPFNNLYQPLLERFQLKSFGIDPQKDLKVEIDGNETLLKFDHLSDSYVYYQPLNLRVGQHLISIKLVNKNLLGGNLFDGVSFIKGGEGKGEGIYEIGDDGKEKFLSILNVHKADINADFDISESDPSTLYYIEVKYKQIYGNNAQVLLTQFNDAVLFKAQAESMPNYPEWRPFGFYYEPVKTNSIIRIGLQAPHTQDPIGTKVLYKDLKINKVFTNKLVFISQDQITTSTQTLSQPTVEFKKVSPVLYEVNLSNVKGSHIIVFSENYSPEWKISLRDVNGINLPLQPLHFSANLYANAWYIKDAPSSYTAKIYYFPQILFLIGGLVSITTILILFMLLIVRYTKRKING